MQQAQLDGLLEQLAKLAGEKLHVVKKHQRHRVVQYPTCRCRDYSNLTMSYFMVRSGTIFQTLPE